MHAALLAEAPQRAGQVLDRLLGPGAGGNGVGGHGAGGHGEGPPFVAGARAALAALPLLTEADVKERSVALDPRGRDQM